ncbi:MAG: ankyrin repeat domain-containing protein [Burkholderiales bacterium]
MRNFITPILLSLLAVSQAACSIPREDVLECGLPDGSKFILKSKYDWDPVAALIPADVQTEKNRTAYAIWYVSSKGVVKKSSVSVDYIGPYSDLNDQTDLSPFLEPCASLGKIDLGLGIPLLEQSFVAKPIRYNGKKIEDMRREKASREAKVAERAHADAEQYAQSLQSAIINGNLVQFEQRLNAGANLNALTSLDNRAPLLVALDKPESAPFALALIQRGANLSPAGLYQGVNVLMLAAGYSTPEVIKALLAKQKFDVNQRNPNGETALSYAVAAGRIDNVRLLLALGADTGIKTSEGSLIDIARLQGQTEIVKLLKQHQR